MLKHLEMAGRLALPKDNTDIRNFWLSAIGIRGSDGVLVSAKNGAVRTNANEWEKVGSAHAEARLCRKLDQGAVVYVSRVRRKDRCLAMARPCPLCQNILKANKVSKVYYSVNEKQYGLWLPHKDQDTIFNC